MPSAKDIKPGDLQHNVMLIGFGGSGKTAQLLTLPGKTFAYLFDPSAIHTLAGHDIDYEEFIPSKLNLAAASLDKKKIPDQASPDIDAHEIYEKFRKDLELRIKDNFFDEYDNVVLDSQTLFGDVVMDRVLHINDRPGRQPHQDDYPAQMVVIKQAMRELTGLPCRLVVTGHVEFKQDEDSGKMMNILRMTGMLKTTLPLLFSDILYCDADEAEGKTKYIVRTQKDRYNPLVRCTLRNKGQALPPTVDVTIPGEFWDDPRGKFGLGKLLLENS